MSCDPGTLVNEASDLLALNKEQRELAILHILIDTAGASADPRILMEASKCLSCIPTREQTAVILYLLCQWANTATGGEYLTVGPTLTLTNLVYEGTDPFNYDIQFSVAFNNAVHIGMPVGQLQIQNSTDGVNWSDWQTVPNYDPTATHVFYHASIGNGTIYYHRARWLSTDGSLYGAWGDLAVCLSGGADIGDTFDCYEDGNAAAGMNLGVGFSGDWIFTP